MVEKARRKKEKHFAAVRPATHRASPRSGKPVHLAAHQPTSSHGKWRPDLPRILIRTRRQHGGPERIRIPLWKPREHLLERQPRWVRRGQQRRIIHSPANGSVECKPWAEYS